MKKRITLLCSLLAIVSLFFACDRGDNFPERPNYEELLTADNVTFSPQTLQIVGNVVPISFVVNVPARFLPHKALLTLTPRLVCGNEMRQATAKTWQGDQVVGRNEVIPYDTPSQLSVLGEFAYDSEKMGTAYELYLEVHVIENSRPTSHYILMSEGELERKI